MPISIRNWIRVATRALVLGYCGNVAATTISVNTVADEINTNGNCALREAIRAANTNLAVDGCPAGSALVADTIVLQNSVTYGLTRVGADDTAINGDLDLADDVIINGGNATIDANGTTTQDRVLHILAGNVVDISNLTITDGRTTSFGAGIRNAGSLTLSNVSVIGNTSTGNAGGGIAAESGSLNLIDSTVSNNSASTLGGGIALLSGTTQASGTVVSNNTTSSDRGGGIWVGTNASLTLTDSSVSGNQSGTNGGGIYNENDLTLLRTVVSGNTAGVAGGTVQFGGGIYNLDTLSLSDSTIVNNAADDSAGMINDGGTLTIRGSTIRGNTAISAGGLRNTNIGVARLVNSTISNNSATGGAGGIANGSSATMELSSVTIAFNTADSDANGSGDGGGLSNSATVTARNSLIGENADASPSGTIFPDCSGAVASAGNNLIENVTGCAISGNTAGNITGLDPNLAALAANGGPTFTHAFPSGAPPHNAGNATGCRDHDSNPIATDQRGTARSQPTRCDIGALEFDNTPPSALSITRLDPSPTSAPTVSYSVTFSEAVSGVIPARFNVIAVGVSGASVTSISGNGASYIVNVATGTGNGTLRLCLCFPVSVRDFALNSAALFDGGETYTIDRALPMFANGFET